MWRPKKYQITVHGHLEESLSERLAGMRITTSTGEERTPVTILEGRLIDQAELSGVLNTLHEWHFPILSVEVLTDDSSGSPENGAEHQEKRRNDHA